MMTPVLNPVTRCNSNVKRGLIFIVDGCVTELMVIQQPMNGPFHVVLTGVVKETFTAV